MIPDFDGTGNLPAGIHDAAWNEFETRYGDSVHRRRLLDGLKHALESPRDAGCRRVYVDGSFVTTKDEPEDFDVCWEAANVDPALLDPALLDFSDARGAQKARFAASCSPRRCRPTRPAPAFWTTSSRTSTGARKGIVALDLKDLP